MTALFSRSNPPKQGPNSNQNKGHLGSRYIYIYVCIFVKTIFSKKGLKTGLFRANKVTIDFPSIFFHRVKNTGALHGPQKNVLGSDQADLQGSRKMQ